MFAKLFAQCISERLHNTEDKGKELSFKINVSQRSKDEMFLQMKVTDKTHKSNIPHRISSAKTWKLQKLSWLVGKKSNPLKRKVVMIPAFHPEKKKNRADASLSLQNPLFLDFYPFWKVILTELPQL